jgi:DNA-binding NarL/FixJ family response regulator
MTATVLIVDDHEGFRSRARRLLERAGYAVVGEAVEGAGAIEAVRRLAPDVVLLDVQLPGGRDGFAIARELALQDAAPKVVLISTRELTDYGRQVDDSSAVGFLEKAQLSPAAFGELIGQPG